MITEISMKILDRLNSAGIQTKQIDFREMVGRQVGALDRPAVNIAVNQSTFTKVTMNKYKAALTISLFLMVQDVAGEKERRFKVYDLIDAIISTLILQDLGLNLQDHLRPLSFNNVTDKNFSDAGYSIYQINFFASYNFKKESPDVDGAVALRTIVSDYFLQDPTDDGVSDGQTIVILNGVWGGSPWDTVPTGTPIWGGHPNDPININDALYGGKPNSTL
jgi:hypothetical protein